MQLLGYFDLYAGALARGHEVQAAIKLVDDLTSKCGDLFFMPFPTNEERETLERVAIPETLAAMLITIFLSYLKSLQTGDRAAIAEAVEKIKWRSRRSIYETGLPPHLLRQLEWMRPRIEFEIRSEGRRVSPDWYLIELVLQSASENAKSSAMALFDETRGLFEKWLSAAKTNKLLWVGATILAREEEYWGKVDYQLWRLRKHWTDLGADRRIDGLPWPKLDFDLLEAGRSKRQRLTLQSMSKQATALSLTTRPDSYPDFAGRFLHATGEALLSAMCKNDADAVNQLFRDFFVSSLMQFDRLRTDADLSDWRGQIAMKVAVAPLLDLMDLSGYSVLFSELHDNSALSESILTVWNEYIDAKNEEAMGSTTTLLLAAISLSEGSFELAHRSIIRTSWSQTVSHELEHVDRKSVADRQWNFMPRRVVLHKSPLVRVFARDEYGMSYDGIDIFIEACIRKRDDGKNIELGPRRRELREALAREEKRDAEGNSEYDE